MQRALTLVGLALSILLTGSQVDARWRDEYASTDPKIQSWYKQQHNANGQWCCDESDGHPYYGGYTIHEDGSVTLDGDHHIPSYMVIKTPNPTGHAVWWYITAGGQHRDYCFAPGTLM